MSEKEEKTIKTKLPKGVTPEMFAKFLELHSKENMKIASLPLNDNEDEFLDVIICVPNRKILGEFEKWMETKPLKAKEILINSCLLTEKDKVKANDDLFYSCVNAISELIPIRKAIIKNL